jgi:hypothetical protein
MAQDDFLSKLDDLARSADKPEPGDSGDARYGRVAALMGAILQVGAKELPKEQKALAGDAGKAAEDVLKLWQKQGGMDRKTAEQAMIRFYPLLDRMTTAFEDMKGRENAAAVFTKATAVVELKLGKAVVDRLRQGLPARPRIETMREEGQIPRLGGKSGKGPTVIKRITR